MTWCVKTSVVALVAASVLAAGTATASGKHYEHAIIKTHPIAYWRLGETSGSIAYSVLGPYSGTYIGSPELGTPGLIRNSGDLAPHFDGVDDHIKANRLTNRRKASWAGGYTLEAWVKTRTRSVEEHILSFNHVNGGTNIALIRDEPTNRFKFHDCEGHGCVAVRSKTAPTIGRIYQVVVTVDASDQGRLYVNGREEATFVSSKRPVHTARFTIGADYDRGRHITSFWDGKIDEVVIYNRAISAKCVAAEWAAGR